MRASILRGRCLLAVQRWCRNCRLNTTFVLMCCCGLSCSVSVMHVYSLLHTLSLFIWSDLDCSGILRSTQGCIYLQISETGASAEPWELHQGIGMRGNEDQNFLLICSSPTHQPSTKVVACGSERRVARSKIEHPAKLASQVDTE